MIMVKQARWEVVFSAVVPAVVASRPVWTMPQVYRLPFCFGLLAHMMFRAG